MIECDVKALEVIRDTYPFFSILVLKNGTQVAGIIQNSTPTFVWIYQFDEIQKSQRKTFLDHGRTWWNQSDRTIPIEVFIGTEFDVFRPHLKGHPRKNIESVHGHLVDLGETFRKRIKRRIVSI